MGKQIINYTEKFLERGVTPLEPILHHHQKIKCIDSEGYKYMLSYRNNILDKRTKKFDRWDKTNPFKAENMRHYAEINAPGTVILSTDEELMDATNKRIRFRCSCCGAEYTKKWCHWLEQPEGRRVCRKCNAGMSQFALKTEKWLKENNILYEKEKYFQGCKNPRTNAPLYFDFVAFFNDEVIVIEVDGQQHYSIRYSKGKEELEAIQFRDAYKNEYCKDNGYILIRIPYWDFNTDEYINKLNKTFFGIE